MPTPSGWPNEKAACRMTALLIAGVPTTPSEIATAFLQPLCEYLRCRFPTVDPHLCETAAEDAILATIHGTNRYDPNRMGLGAFLRMAARGDLLNLFRKEARLRHAIPLEFVAEPAGTGNGLSDVDALGWDDPRLAAELAVFDPKDQVVFALMCEGERQTAAFAVALGLTAESPDELAAEVKRHKDRLKRRLARAVGGAE